MDGDAARGCGTAAEALDAGTGTGERGGSSGGVGSWSDTTGCTPGALETGEEYAGLEGADLELAPANSKTPPTPATSSPATSETEAALGRAGRGAGAGTK